jgi:hypothetical protein
MFFSRKELSRKVFSSAVFSFVFFSSPAAFALTLKQYVGPECGQSPVVERAPSCGVELYNVAVSASCGADVYDLIEHPNCGAASYNVAESPSCGASSYNVGTSGQHCGYDINDLLISPGQSTPINRGGWTYEWIGVEHRPFYNCDGDGRCRTSSHPHKLYRGKKAKSCAHKAFGPATYNSCAHPDHGVERWNTCQIWKSHGTCRHPDNGVEVYNSCVTSYSNNSCQVYFTPAELPTFLSSADSDADFRIKNMALWASATMSAAQNEKDLGCLIAQAATGVLAGDVVFEHSVLTDMQGYFKQIAGKTFELANFPTNSCASPLKNVRAILCDPSDTSNLCASKAGFEAAYQSLVQSQQELLTLKQDTVARSQGSYQQMIDSVLGKLAASINQIDGI